MNKAIVLCGGKGTRLRPYTYSIPKPMLPLGRRPILEFVVNNLKANGFDDILFTVGYLKESIMDYFRDGSEFGVSIDYMVEEDELNTAGSILAAKEFAGNDGFLVSMGDHLTTINLRDMAAFHAQKKCVATVALKSIGTPLEYGVAELDREERIYKFDEKPIMQNFINAGIYMFEPAIYRHIKKGDDFARNVFPRLLAKNEPISGYIFNEYWMDIGRIHDYEHVNQIMSIIDMCLGDYK
jgi:NDP-sugar pyrophosphorylase family protein